MTREDAIKGLKSLVEVRRKYYDMQTMKDEIECLDMAIKALEQEPCEDCISREAVKEMLTEEWTKYMPMELDINLSFVMEKINELPSITPQQTRWIPVNERLPESDVDVLTQYSDYSMSVDSRTASSSGWFWADEELPIAWMPLPEPYEAESEDKE